MARLLRLGMVIAPMAILLSAGCDSRPSLTSPTKVNDVSRSNAQLNGTFTSQRGSAQGLRAFSQTGLEEITVEVLDSAGVDTGIRAQVSSDGSFSVEGLPVPSFTLLFRNGVGELIGEFTFTNVQDGQTIFIELKLEGDTLELVDETRVGGNGVVVEGAIDDDSSDDQSDDDSESEDSDDDSSDDNSSDDNSSGQAAPLQSR